MKNETTDISTTRRAHILRRFASALLPIGLAVMMQGCATMFSGTTDEVHFASNPPGGSVIVGDEIYELPATVELSKRTDEVTFTHPDYPDQVVELGKTFQGGYLLLDILFTPGFGLVGILVDTAAGSWSKLDPQATCDHTLPDPPEGDAQEQGEEVTAAIAEP